MHMTTLHTMLQKASAASAAQFLCDFHLPLSWSPLAMWRAAPCSPSRFQEPCLSLLCSLLRMNLASPPCHMSVGSLSGLCCAEALLCWGAWLPQHSSQKTYCCNCGVCSMLHCGFRTFHTGLGLLASALKSNRACWQRNVASAIVA